MERSNDTHSKLQRESPASTTATSGLNTPGSGEFAPTVDPVELAIQRDCTEHVESTDYANDVPQDNKHPHDVKPNEGKTWPSDGLF